MRQRAIFDAPRPHFLLCDLFKHLFKRKQKVFLCGSKVEDEFRDLRAQVKLVMKHWMGCSAFLGEDIDRILTTTKVDHDHLTIEIDEAEKSDLIVMFLGSVGTVAELTAFVMTKSIQPKLLVFNDVQFKEEKSFLNEGPIKMLGSEQLVFYNADEPQLTQKMVEHLDRAVAQCWFNKSKIYCWTGLEFEMFATLAAILVCYPVRYKDLVQLLPITDKSVRASLNHLIENGLTTKREKKYLPGSNWQGLQFGPVMRDIARTRLRLMNVRLQDEENVSDYRLITT